MLCDKCGKNNATTHIKQIINGVVTERNLCSSCAAEEGYSKFPHGGLADMLASMFGDISGLGTEADETCCGLRLKIFGYCRDRQGGLRRVLQNLLQ